jgi:hypothetical protein
MADQIAAKHRYVMTVPVLSVDLFVPCIAATAPETYGGGYSSGTGYSTTSGYDDRGYSTSTSTYGMDTTHAVLCVDWD